MRPIRKKKTQEAGWKCICGKILPSFRDYFRHVTAANRKYSSEQSQEKPDGN